jgi:hypothetical protein
VRFERVPLMCYNTSAISVAKNPVFHNRMRHLEWRHHFLRDHVEKGDIKMRYIDTERQWPISLPNPLTLLALLLYGGGDSCLPSLWLGLRGSLCFILYTCIFCLSLAFSSYSPKSLCFTYYTSFSLLNYAYHCARMSSNEMWTFLLDHAR